MRDVYSQILRTAGLESAGLFWIGAELAILFMMIAARRHIQARPLPPRLELQDNEKRRARAWCFAFLVLAAIVLGRHVVNALAPLPQNATALLIGRVRVHLAVWSGFITAWVALELAIVYQGLRGYLALKALLRPVASKPERPAKPSVAILCLAAVFLLHASAPAQMLLAEARIANQVYYNAMYLYLRLAGVVWILAEWVAALILWRAYALVASAARRIESAHV
ncbi:MAG TPA: hypothetical protein VMZ06_15405 [Candidatus Bathyarchaeia archaeon]|nr:hypothetical protein [Candidatus Bathyarchaeia archaeon]